MDANASSFSLDPRVSYVIPHVLTALSQTSLPPSCTQSVYKPYRTDWVSEQTHEHI